MIYSSFLPTQNLSSLDSHQTDVLIVGSGAAGLMTARLLPKHLKVTLLSKSEVHEGCTYYAQGGIACVTSEEDSFESHIQDTLEAGAGLCQKKSVKHLVKEAPAAIEELTKDITFDSGEKGFLLGKEGAHSFRRILHAGGDATGRIIEEGLIKGSSRQDNLEVLSPFRLIDLMMDEGRCTGAMVFDSNKSKMLKIYSRVLVLATGGCSQLYQESTNPETSTGDGVASAFRAGAKIRDMEFIQFHPTALFIAGAPRFLISEAVRGEAAILRNSSGKAFMQGKHTLADLAPRDIVSRAIVHEMIDSGEPCVFLDLTHLDRTKIFEHFPTIASVCKNYGLDISRQWIPVRPAAHYTMGGIQTELQGKSSIEGLYACGEVASTGVHGANRLASNSLLEALVFSKKVAEDIESNIPKELNLKGSLAKSETAEMVHDLNPADLISTLKSIMWRNAGVFREKGNLKKSRRRILSWLERPVYPAHLDKNWYDFRNLLQISFLVLEGALLREESRGAHHRDDFPLKDDANFLKHTVLSRKDF